MRKFGELPKPTKLQSSIAKKNARKVLLHPPENRPSDEANNAFVKQLVHEELITENLTYWNRLSEVYGYYQRPVPKHFVDKVKAEAYLVASLHMHVGRGDIYTTYMKAAEAANIGFLKGEEEQFIEEKIMRAVITKKGKPL